jgi:hypothetical protein
MAKPKGSCDPERLKLLLADEIPPDIEAEVIEHIAKCSKCRAMLDSLAGDADWWLEVKTCFTKNAEVLSRNDVSPESNFPIDSECAAAGDSFAADFAVDFLEPCQQPDTLGRLDDIEIREMIDCGGMGVILKGYQRELGRYVAVKLMAPHLAASGSARKRFTREARAAAAIVHPHVMPIHSVNSSGRLPYLVMPFVACESLQQRLDRDGPLELKEILRISSQIAAGLAAAHAQGLVHRDVKPANILLEKGVDRVMLTDFGLARAVDDASLTKTGVIAGTPQYMSPEQARGDAIDHRSDLFSLGSVMYAMCTGRPPFRAETSYGILRRITDNEPRAIREVNPDIPDWLEATIGVLQQKTVDERLNSAAELSALMEQCLAHVQQPAEVDVPSRVRELVPRRRNLETATNYRSEATIRRRLKTWLGAIAVLVLAALAGWAIVGNREQVSVPPANEAQPGGEAATSHRVGNDAESHGAPFPPGEEFSTVTFEPKYKAVVIVNAAKKGENGPSCRGDMGRTGKSSCGPKSSRTKLSWEFTEHRDGSDYYEFYWQLTVNGLRTNAKVLTVGFDGKAETTVIDAEHHIVIRKGPFTANAESAGTLPPSGSDADPFGIAPPSRVAAANLKSLGAAFHAYHNVHGHFPPAVVIGPNGKTPHSWRVELLPHLKSTEAQTLFDEYRMDEAWDSPHNKRLLDRMPDTFRHPEADPASTNSSYFVLTGEDRIFDGTKSKRFADIKDGLANTLLVVEADRQIPWTKPEDIHIDKDAKVPPLGGFSEGEFQVSLADGSVRKVSQSVSQDRLQSMILVDDGRVPPLGDKASGGERASGSTRTHHAARIPGEEAANVKSREKIEKLQGIHDITNARFELGLVSIEDVLRSEAMLVDAELESATQSVERKRLQTKLVHIARQLENRIQAKVNSGVVSEEELLSATAKRLQAEINLLGASSVIPKLPDERVDYARLRDRLSELQRKEGAGQTGTGPAAIQARHMPKSTVPDPPNVPLADDDIDSKTQQLIERFLERVETMPAPCQGRRSLHTRNGEGQITELRLKDAKLTPCNKLIIGKMKHLVVLDLSNSNISDSDLEHFDSLSQLVELNLSGTAIDGSGLRRLASLKKLSRLNIGDTKVTDDTISHLANLKSLRHLCAYRNQISDRGLEPLVRLKNLETLKLGETNVTDDGISALASLAKLRSLSLNETAVTEAGLREAARNNNLAWISSPRKTVDEFVRRMTSGDLAGASDMVAIGLLVPEQGTYSEPAVTPLEATARDRERGRVPYGAMFRWQRTKPHPFNGLAFQLAVDRGGIVILRQAIVKLEEDKVESKQ